LKAISERVFFFELATGLGVLFSLFLFLKKVSMRQIFIETLLVLAISVTAFLFVFTIREDRKLKAALLIIENKILHIQLAKIDFYNYDESETALPIGGIEVFVSCFGILIDSKVIKFNLEGIHLKAVEIGREFICLSYGTDEQTHIIRILHEAFDSLELQSIIERFRYETGVVPVIGVCS